MLAIQQFLKTNGLQAAINQFSLKVLEDDNLIQLNYHMIDSPKTEETNECRGLILNKHTFEIVAFPFYRFFNQQEGHAKTLNYSTSKLYEKADGSMLISYYNPFLNKRVVATRGSILASGSVGNNENKTFSDLFNETVSQYNQEALNNLPNDLTVVFELIGPENRIVTPYSKNELKLLTVRNNTTLNEYNDDNLTELSNTLQIPRVKCYDFNSQDDIMTILNTFQATDEGFVMVDFNQKINGSYARIKIKNPRYLALHNLVGAGEQSSFKRFVLLVKNGDKDEVISYFPEYTELLNKIEININNLANEIDSYFNSIKHLSDNRKEFAMKAKEFKLPSAMFLLLDGKALNGKECLFNMNDDKLAELVY